MNITLARTSIFSSLVHACAFILVGVNDIVFATIIACGLFTSILNHSTTNDIAKYADRTMMAIGACFDFYKTNGHALLLISIGFYFFAKIYKLTALHVIAHALLTILHLLFV